MKNTIRFSKGLTQGEMIKKADVIIKALKKDKEELAIFGVDKAYISAIDKKLKACLKSDSDRLVNKNRREVFENRDKAIAAFIKTVGNPEVIMQLHYGSRITASFEKYGTKSLKTAKLTNLIKIASELLESIDKNAELELPAELDQKLEWQFEEMEALVEMSQEARQERSRIRAVRVKQYNELYDLCSEAAFIGKHYWKEHNQARYSEYVLNRSHTSPEQANVDVGEPSIFSS